jgi:basic amino acid/polyamine antiporter, APA family
VSGGHEARLVVYPMQVEQPGATTPSLVRVIGVRALTASCVNLMIGASIFVLPAAVAASLGPAALVAYLVCAVAMGLVALCFAEAGSRVPATGGVYAYVERAFGPYAGFLTGMLLTVSQIVGSAGVAVVLLGVLGEIAPVFATSNVRVALTIVLYALLAWINIRGVALGARVVELLTLAKIAPLLLLIAAGVLGARRGNLVVTHAPAMLDVGRASLVLFFAFTGMEGALSVSGEVVQPARTVPRSIILSLLFVAALYAMVQISAQGILGAALAIDQVSPLATATSRVFGSAGRAIILAGAAISTLGYLVGDMLASPRVLYALAQDGFLPQPFVLVHARRRTPHVSIIAYAVMACVFALSGTFRALAVLAVVTTLVIYGACCIATLQLRRLDVRAEQPPFLTSGGPLVPLLAVTVVVALLTSASRSEFIAVGALLAISSVLYFFRRAPRVVPAIAS